MDTAGDGFFAVFEAPERAVRCAESIISALALLGIAVRAGVHTGECEVIAGKVGGMAVVIGARIAALASCEPDLDKFDLTGYCDPELERAIAAALDLQATDPAGASDARAAIDRMVVDAAASIPFSYSLRQDFVSRRVGNTLIHPVTGPLLAQIWVQRGACDQSK